MTTWEFDVVEPGNARWSRVVGHDLTVDADSADDAAEEARDMAIEMIQRDPRAYDHATDVAIEVEILDDDGEVIRRDSYTVDSTGGSTDGQ